MSIFWTLKVGRKRPLIEVCMTGNASLYSGLRKLIAAHGPSCIFVAKNRFCKFLEMG